MSAAPLIGFLGLAAFVLGIYAVCERDRARRLREQLEDAQRERDALRSKLADVIDEAGKVSATDGGWLAKLLQRWAGA